nr:adhesion G protein-coupled receptor L4-like [Pocillopora verrucosa]
MMKALWYALGVSSVYFMTVDLVVQRGWAMAERNDKCVNAPFLKQSECSGSKCKERLKSKWQRIKCLPFSTSGRKGLCSKWCHEGGTSTQSCYDAFHRFSSEQIYFKNGDENFKFEVVYCRSFEFIIRLERVLSRIERPEVTIQPAINLTINDAKQQFRTSIQSIWSNNSHGDTNSTQDQKLEDTVFAAFIFEYFILSIARERLHVTNPEFIDVDEDLNFRVRRNDLQRGDDFLFHGSSRGNFIKIPSANLDRDSTVLGLEYTNLSKLLSNYSADTERDNTTKILDSVIMSAVTNAPPKVLPENITLVFKNMQVNRKKRTCVFWSFSEENFGSWSSEGCQTKLISDHYTECVCNHLTHFAVLMDFTDNADDGKDKTLSSYEHHKILTLLTRVGMALSLIGVILTIISYLQLTDRNLPLCHIRVSLTSCIGAGHIIFFAGIDSTGNQAACVAVAALMQYFLMASFCWMLVEGIYIYLFVVKVYNISDKMHRYHGFCWGLPAIIVAVSLVIAAGNDGIETFVNDENCWMSSSNKVIWIFVSFVGLIAIINMTILVRVIKEVTTIQQVKDSPTEQIRLGVRACVVLAPLLGVTWLIGFLVPLHIAFSYIFVILNSTQGLFIFFFHCLGNSEIRGRFKRRVQKIHPSAFNQRPGDDRGNSQARQSHSDTGIPVQDQE